MASPDIRIGTSGWNYSHWQSTFYPKELEKQDWLQYYADRFNSVEINKTFYNLPEKTTFKTWAEHAPQDFLFAVKASRYITHMKKLREPDEPVDKLFKAISGLGAKRGPVLFQLPPHWHVNAERLERVLQSLPDDERFVFEFRDETWWTDEIANILEQHNAAFCIYELAGTQTPELITADFVYVRLHGPGDAYEGDYHKNSLHKWRRRIESWIQDQLDVYIYFDNDQNGFAPKNARELMEIIQEFTSIEI